VPSSNYLLSDFPSAFCKFLVFEGASHTLQLLVGKADRGGDFALACDRHADFARDGLRFGCLQPEMPGNLVREIEYAVPSTSSVAVVRTRGLMSTGTGLRS
jgi:hypothetical protein